MMIYVFYTIVFWNASKTSIWFQYGILS